MLWFLEIDFDSLEIILGIKPPENITIFSDIDRLTLSLYHQTLQQDCAASFDGS